MITPSKRLLQDWESLLDRDVIPTASRYLRWTRTPLGSLSLAAVASGLCGAYLHSQGFVVMSGLLGVTALGLVWPWLSLLGLSGTLSFNVSRCREGERARVHLTLRNRMPWGVWGVSVKSGFEESAGESRGETSMACLSFVPGNRTSVIESEFIPEARGEYPLGKPGLTCGFPFGLSEASRPLTVSHPLLVWPRTFPVASIPEAAEGESSFGAAFRDRAGNWGDPLGVRPYRRGDSIRRVHWGQTARQGELIVCEVQSNSVPRVQIVLDTHRDSHVGTGANGSREWSIRVAASLAEGWIRQGVDVALLLETGPVAATGRTVKARKMAALDALARLRSGTGPDLAGLLDSPESRRRRSSLRVVVTTDVGLDQLLDQGKSASTDRFVVLRSQAFGGADRGDDSTRPAFSPWIWIDGPEAVPASLRRAGKGVLRES